MPPRVALQLSRQAMLVRSLGIIRHPGLWRNAYPFRAASSGAAAEISLITLINADLDIGLACDQ